MTLATSQHTDATKIRLRYEIQHKTTGEVKYFNHPFRALAFMQDPVHEGLWDCEVLDIGMTQILETIY
jgi:hypothetical protein